MDHKVKKEYLINAVVILTLIVYSVVVSFSYGKNLVNNSKFQIANACFVAFFTLVVYSVGSSFFVQATNIFKKAA